VDDEDRKGPTKFHGDFVAHYRQHLDGKTAIAFCCTVEHGYLVAEAFNKAGIPAEMITGRDSRDERRAMLERLGRGETKVLASCSLIGEGVDVPSVAGCIMLRPTASYSLYLQMIGRCLRPQPGKVAVVLDHVKNIELHGHYLDVPEWTLEGKQKKRTGSAPMKVCPECYAAVPAAAAVCPECGHSFQVERSHEVEVSDGKLIELERVRVEKQKRKEAQAKCQSLLDLEELGRQLGHKPGWARHVWAAREAKRNRYSYVR
jgi:superfamily II DNA or RNA helicase